MNNSKTPMASSRHPVRTLAFSNLKDMTTSILDVYLDGEISRSLKKAILKHKEIIHIPMDFRKQVLATTSNMIASKLADFRHNLYPRILRLSGAVEAEELVGKSEELGTDLIFKLDGIDYLIDCKKQDRYGPSSRLDIVKALINKKSLTGATFAYMWFCNDLARNGKVHYATALANTQGAYVCYGNELFRLLNIHCSNGQKIDSIVDDIIAESKIYEQLKIELNNALGNN